MRKTMILPAMALSLLGFGIVAEAVPTGAAVHDSVTRRKQTMMTTTTTVTTISSRTAALVPVRRPVAPQRVPVARPPTARRARRPGS